MIFTNIDQSSSAIISECGTYRYLLSRAWKYPIKEQPFVLFILLNPSIADHLQNDPTIRRCIGFAKGWGFNRMVIGNLFALRSTDPQQLYSHPQPVGPENMKYLKQAIQEARKVVCGWGNHGSHLEQYEKVVQLINDPLCLGLTKTGQPRHPLYLKYKTELKAYPKKELAL